VTVQKILRFDVEQNHWTQIPMIPGASKPPPMAGHSASVHGQFMIIFGGLQKQRSSIGQFSSSNDVWSFDIKSKI
jgi:F-box protein 42